MIEINDDEYGDMWVSVKEGKWLWYLIIKKLF